MNIVITGCSQGIGNEIARQLASERDNKVVGISRNSNALKELERSIGSSAFKGLSFDIELLRNNQEKLFIEIKDFLGSVDILINNAGYLCKNDFLTFQEEEIEHIFNTNLFAPARLIQLLLPLMGKKVKTHIVNIGSMGGYQGSPRFPGLSWYGSSKAALANLTESLAVELKEYNIAINCLALGSVETQMLAKAFPGFKPPLKPSEMAGYIKNFALNGHTYFNGKILPVSLTNP